MMKTSTPVLGLALVLFSLSGPLCAAPPRPAPADEVSVLGQALENARREAASARNVAATSRSKAERLAAERKKALAMLGTTKRDFDAHVRKAAAQKTKDPSLSRSEHALAGGLGTQLLQETASLRATEETLGATVVTADEGASSAKQNATDTKAKLARLKALAQANVTAARSAAQQARSAAGKVRSVANAAGTPEAQMQRRNRAMAQDFELALPIESLKMRLAAAEATSTPASTSASKPLPNVRSFAGKWPWVLFGDREIDGRLRVLLGKSYATLVERVEVGQPLEIAGEYVVGEGCKAHACVSEIGVIAVGAKGDMHVTVFSDSLPGKRQSWSTPGATPPTTYTRRVTEARGATRRRESGRGRPMR